jgi:hypothetical protein
MVRSVLHGATASACSMEHMPWDAAACKMSEQSASVVDSWSMQPSIFYHRGLGGCTSITGKVKQARPSFSVVACHALPCTSVQGQAGSARC